MSVPKKLLVLPPILLGLVVVGLAARNRAAPAKRPPAEVARTLRVIQAQQVTLVPRVIAYGTSKPSRVWRVVPEVTGRITALDERVKPGGIVPGGADIVRIDSATYTLTVQRLEAEIAQTQAQLSELKGVTANLRASQEIEQSNLDLAKSDLERSRRLRSEGTATERQVDQAQQAYLSRRQSYQSIANQLRLIPSQRSALQASLAVKRANLAQAQLDLAKTGIRTPFACRIHDVELEVSQYVKAGEVLFEASSLDKAEVASQLTVAQAHRLMGVDRHPALVDLERMNKDLIEKLFGGTVVVRLRSGERTFSWPARLERIRERVDQETRTVSFVVAVDKPYDRATRGASPPLLAGMYCEVELAGRPRPNLIVVPRLAVHEGRLYLVDDQKRLRSRPVVLGARQGDMVVVKEGLAGGEAVVVSDPTPAVEGGLVEPVRDEALERRIVLAAGS